MFHVTYSHSVALQHTALIFPELPVEVGHHYTSLLWFIFKVNKYRKLIVK